MLRVALVGAAPDPGVPPGCVLAVPVRQGQVPAAYREAAAADGFSGEAGTALDLLGGPSRVLLVGLGDSEDPAAAEAAGAMAAARALRATGLAIELGGLPAAAASACAAGACLRAWRFDGLRTRLPDDAMRLETLYLVSTDPALPDAWVRQSAAVEGSNFARDLVTSPANLLTPQGFLARLHLLVDAGVQLEVIEGDRLRDAGFGGLRAVGGGSAHTPAVAVLRWSGTLGTRPVVFAGKGITFDTGGISIKPADRMWDMRADMAGAAACAGAMLALARRRSPASAIAVLALAENATGAASYRPGDVIASLAGATVEVIDTDAEGRLVLMDALAYAVRETPRAIIDVATLTGSVVVALGHERAGLFCNDPALAAAVAAAGAAVGERVWHLPIDESHRRALDSDIADLRHCVPERGQPDASQAAAFLREFVGGLPWAHLDIAGVESREEGGDRYAAGATGFGVRLLDLLVQGWFEGNQAREKTGGTAPPQTPASIGHHG